MVMRVTGRVYQKTETQILFGMERDKRRWGWLPLSYVVWEQAEDEAAAPDRERQVTIQVPDWLVRKELKTRP